MPLRIEERRSQAGISIVSYQESSTPFPLNTEQAAHFLGIAREELALFHGRPGVIGEPMRLSRDTIDGIQQPTLAVWQYSYTDKALLSIASYLMRHPLPNELGMRQLTTLNSDTARVEYIEESLIRSMFLRTSSQPQASPGTLSRMGVLLGSFPLPSPHV